MSYSESGIDLLFISSNHDALERFNSGFRKKIEKKGGQYDGPTPLPKVKPELLDSFLLYISDSESGKTVGLSDYPDWLFDALDSEEHLDMMVSTSKNNDPLYARRYQIMGEHVTSSVLSFDLPEEIMAVATSTQKTHLKSHQKDVQGTYTWDPNVDHIPSHPDGPW